jgi:hypothetical protein
MMMAIQVEVAIKMMFMTTDYDDHGSDGAGKESRRDLG